ncbi:hypothetical protein F5B22DRAFT_643417 [Xylaria bambusicola]|uniref:uncharacterized protein n=1 Tax=Xylaria bambusicola TaxID=326684 RepID=UPI0020083F35|nr:uncharacterized protein F5B22DRAFT_643417 [Xylaria bambusicola]KAI0521831.1 hypothetical protein F5B22DRAFT_643417 [Xylaria bambusicola]
MLGSSGPSLVTVDLFANRSDPPNPPDLSDRRGSRLLGPTSPTQQPAPEGDDNSLMTPSDHGQGGSMSEPKTEHGGEADADVVVDDNENDDAPPPLRLNKGKTPETSSSSSSSARLLSAPLPQQDSSPSSGDQEAAQAHDEPHSQIHAGVATGEERSGTLVDVTDDITTHQEDIDIPNHATQPESQDSQDSSYPSSLFEEPCEHDATTTAASALVGEAATSSWKKKEKQKADPEAETRSPSEASDGEHPFRPLDVGDPGWEKSAGRPPTKLPIRFRDAVGRNFLFPWEKAKTWAGMRKLINSCFIHVDVLGPHVMAGRYDLSVNLPYPMDAANEILSPGAPLTPIPPAQASSSSATETPSSFNTIASSSSSSSTPGPSNSQQQRSSFVVLPELWEDTVEPGMLVVQHMWPFQTPNYVAQPAQPSPPQPQQHHHPTGPPPPGHHMGTAGRGRGARGRGRGGAAGAGLFAGRGGGIMPSQPPPRGKQGSARIGVDRGSIEKNSGWEEEREGGKSDAIVLN